MTIATTVAAAVTRRSKATESELPLLHQDAEYRAEFDKLQTITAQHTTAEDEAEAIHAELRRFNSTREGLREAATELLDGVDVNFDHNTTVDRLRTAQRRVDVLHQAIAVQNERLEAAKRVATNKICKALQREHRTIAEGLLTAAKQMQHAIAANRAFEDRMERECVAVVAPLIHLTPAPVVDIQLTRLIAEWEEYLANK